MAHKHWSKDNALYDLAPTCDFRTVKECDDALRAYRAEGKAAEASRQAAAASDRRARREAAFQNYEAKEQARIASVLGMAQTLALESFHDKVSSAEAATES
jgi:hypothetical protein